MYTFEGVKKGAKADCIQRRCVTKGDKFNLLETFETFEVVVHSLSRGEADFEKNKKERKEPSEKTKEREEEEIVEVVKIPPLLSVAADRTPLVFYTFAVKGNTNDLRSEHFSALSISLWIFSCSKRKKAEFTPVFDTGRE